MKLINNFNRNRAIKSYIKNLPGFLKKDYGRSKAYTPMQIHKTIERYGLSIASISFGIAIFSSKEVFDEHYQEIGESYNYDEIRSEVADKYFQGDIDFEILDFSGVSVSYDIDAGGDGGGGGGG